MTFAEAVAVLEAEGAMDGVALVDVSGGYVTIEWLRSTIVSNVGTGWWSWTKRGPYIFDVSRGTADTLPEAIRHALGRAET